MSTRSAHQDVESVVLDLHRRHLIEMLVRVEMDVELTDGRGVRSAFAALRAELDDHVRLEEQMLTPSFDARRSRRNPSAIMRVEHDQMRELLDLLEWVVA